MTLYPWSCFIGNLSESPSFVRSPHKPSRPGLWRNLVAWVKQMISATIKERTKAFAFQFICPNWKDKNVFPSDTGYVQRTYARLPKRGGGLSFIILETSGRNFFSICKIVSFQNVCVIPMSFPVLSHPHGPRSDRYSSNSRCAADIRLGRYAPTRRRVSWDATRFGTWPFNR